MTTLADLNPGERAQCIGMWCNVSTERYTAVLVRTYMADDVRYAQMLSPEINDYYTASLESITPRPDLPRAWTPQGTPTPGEWGYRPEYYEVWGEWRGIPTYSHSYDEARILTEENTQFKNAQTRILRRFITEWEPA